MNKICIMTFHTAKNYGAVLQAYALQTYVKSICDDTKVIDYSPKEIQYKLIPRATSLKGAVTSILSIPHILKKKQKFSKFEQFVCENLDLTEKYESTQALYNNTPEGALFITGSDQVFNPNRAQNKKKAFFLDFVPDNIKKISYAASFGVTKIEEGTKSEIVGYLNSFDFLSSRETWGVKMIEQLTGRSAVETVDPTLLLKQEEWESKCKPYSGLPERYILFYKLLGSGDEAVTRIAKEMNLPVVIITDLAVNRLKSKYMLRDVGPEQFLWLYSNADFVVTNSFHGIAFSIIFKKQFLSCDLGKTTQQRTINLLNKLELESKIIYDDVLAESRITINYEKIGKLLNEITEKSKAYLKTAIEASGI